MTEAEECRAFLDHACRDEPEMRRRIDEMLELRETAEDFFEFEPEPESEAAEGKDEGGLGARIGRYRLIERIGAGGCGAVYLAEQLEPVQRKVALKVVRLGMDTESVIARFEMERQALASMDHPNIARVLDAGATGSGRPFFVMELVDGEKITDFCDSNRLGLRERLELFVQVCQAIQHAHQKGVIHRDIKPSNVLVRWHDGVAVPKVIDFGIAKAATGGLGGDSTFTAFDQFLGTPAYMSPEQAAGGLDVDTRSDIYSLGVLLYELLVGRPPLGVSSTQEGGMEEIRRVLREDEPPKPSSRLASLDPEVLVEVAAWRRMDPLRLVQMVKGDLDWITMKAMEKDRGRRYETANGFALDLQRHLRNEPVAAGPPGPGYRFGKLVRRNRPAFVAGGLTLLALVAGFGTSTWMFFREREVRQEQARLRHEAESARARADLARANEAALRKLAEFRETIAEAAVKLAHGDMAGADALLATVPVDQTPSSLEAANSYRAVGEWHLKEGRWEKAAARFVGCARAMSSVDSTDSDSVSRNLLPAAAAICQSGDRESYEAFRRMAVARFGGTAHLTVAEQIVKATLLLPPDVGLLEDLEPLAEMIEDELTSGGLQGDVHLVGWRHFSLVLYHYRNGDFILATKWAERCLHLPEQNASRRASVRIILAMIEHRFGRTENARQLLEVAGPEVREKLSGKMDWGGSVDGFWFDWVNAGILLKEATDLLESKTEE